MNVRLRQVEISLDGTKTVKTQAGATQMIVGNVEMPRIWERRSVVRSLPRYDPPLSDF